jgi:hypothetical protein
MRRSNAVALSCTLSILVALALAAPLFAAELVLVPIWYQGYGAQGSQWLTHLSVYNDGTYIEPLDGGVLPCQWLIDPCPRGFWKDMMLVYQAPESRTGGFVMAVPDGSPLVYSLRVFEARAHLEDLGVDIPVVRERDLRAGPIQLMDVPASDPDVFRYTLRVYALGAAPFAAVRINGYMTMFDGSSDLVLTRDLVLAPVRHGLGHHYAEETEVVRQLILATGGMGRLRVEIEPLTPHLRWWGMLSATNNRTQDVTIVTPN